MDEILQFLEKRMEIEGKRFSPFMAEVSGKIYPPVESSIAEIKKFCSATTYTPLFSSEKGRDIVRLVILPHITEKPKYWLNILLFLATVLTTLIAGSMNSGGDPFKNFSDILKGIPFSFSLMAILTCHELGHYFVSRKEGMIASLPYFIPVPFHFLGTFGAIIKMRSVVPTRKALLKVGMAGPLCGFVVALFVSAIGIYLSEIKFIPGGGPYLRLGDSLLFYLINRLIHPVIPEGADIFLHPMAFAGWIGFLVTSMNLIPIGQLDGGHVAYSLFLKKQKLLYLPLIIILLGFGILWQGWIIWGLLAFILTRKEPLIQDTLTPLSRREKLLALIPLIILLLTFIPKPFEIY